MNEQEEQTVQQYTDTQRPICIGRFQIDMPQQLAWSQSLLTVNDARITAQPMSRAMFERHIAKRKAELEETQYVDEADRPFLKQVHEPQPDMVILEHNASQGEPDFARVLEGYKYEGLTMFKVEIDANDLDSDANRYQWERQHMQTDKPEKLRQVTALLAHLHPLKEGEMPDKPGICFANGYLEGGAEDKVPGASLPERKEELDALFVDNQHPDIAFGFDLDNYTQEDDTVIERVNGSEHLLKDDENFKILRKGISNLSDYPRAEEWLISNTTDSHVKGNYFYLEANSKNGSPKTPFINITFRNGEYIDTKPRTPGATPKITPKLERATFTDAEAVGLWDAVIPTFKPRKDAF